MADDGDISGVILQCLLGCQLGAFGKFDLQCGVRSLKRGDAAHCAVIHHQRDGRNAQHPLRAALIGPQVGYQISVQPVNPMTVLLKADTRRGESDGGQGAVDELAVQLGLQIFELLGKRGLRDV